MLRAPLSPVTKQLTNPSNEGTTMYLDPTISSAQAAELTVLGNAYVNAYHGDDSEADGDPDVTHGNVAAWLLVNRFPHAHTIDVSLDQGEQDGDPCHCLYIHVEYESGAEFDFEFNVL